MSIWPLFRYHPVQYAWWSYNGQFAAVVAGRRSGKTELCRRKLILRLPIKKPWPNPIYIYLLPTREQAKRVVWYDILRMIPAHWIAKGGINRTELSITTVWGSKLYIAGADKPHRIEGLGVDGVVIDESSDQRPGLFERTVLPMLAERDGFCWRIGVPKKTGIGRVEFREFYEKGLRGEGGIASFHWKSSEILTAKQIEILAEHMDAVVREEQLDAIWKDVGSNVYYNFTSDNITHDAQYNPLYPVLVGCDFNVDPMCWTLSHEIDGVLHTFDEIFMRDTNTPKTLNYLLTKYHQNNRGWFFYGDASSRSRKTSAVKTDYLIVKDDVRFGNKKVYFFRRNPHMKDRFASVNRAFRDGNGKVRAIINPCCAHLINDLNSVSYKEFTSEIEDYSGTDIGHMADGFGYMVHHVMPVRVTTHAIPAVFSSAG